MSATNETPETIADILQEHKALSGQSFSQMAQDAELSKSTMHWLANQTDSEITTQTLTKLSQGLGIPAQRLIRAARGQMSVPVDRMEVMDRIAVQLSRMSDDDFDRAATIIASLAEKRHG